MEINAELAIMEHAQGRQRAHLLRRWRFACLFKVPHHYFTKPFSVQKSFIFMLAVLYRDIFNIDLHGKKLLTE